MQGLRYRRKADEMLKMNAITLFIVSQGNESRQRAPAFFPVKFPVMADSAYGTRTHSFLLERQTTLTNLSNAPEKGYAPPDKAPPLHVGDTSRLTQRRAKARRRREKTTEQFKQFHRLTS
jgi:hypothetical protein